MKRLPIGLWIVCFVAATSGWAGQPSALSVNADPLGGRWLILEGKLKEQGYFFDGKLGGVCGNADFREHLRRVNFDRTLAASNAAPWGDYSYRFDAPTGVLTLSRPDAPDIRCFLKYREEQLRRITPESAQWMPFVCVFYEPESRRAFLMVRKGEEKISLTTQGGSICQHSVFVPFEDPLTGTWAVLPPHSNADGHLEFRFDTPPPAPPARLVVHADNSAVMTEDGTVVRFRLHQCDPTRWIIDPFRDSPCSTGTVVLEETAGRVLGPSIAVTHWVLPDKTVAAVLRAEGTLRPPSVPMIRLQGAETLSLRHLLERAQLKPTSLLERAQRREGAK
ncbi:MAG: hypothetical protein N3D11_04435 [Candidatus Sumerlaeia bacterium]|nr:hypothetical protein [Candidatus Sumerlaeia bacterium]